MKLFKKSYNWSEPKAVRKAYFDYRMFPVWCHFVYAGILLSFIILAFAVRKDEPISEKLIMVGVGAIMAGVGSYVIALIDSLAGSNIIVNASGFTRMDSTICLSVPILLLLKYRHHEWKWKDIAYVYIHTEEFDGKEIQFLEVVGHDEEKIGVIGLPMKKFKMDKLIGVLEENGCDLHGLEEELVEV